MNVRGIGAGLLLGGLAALGTERFFVAGIDANGVVQESLLLPLGSFAIVAGAILLVLATLLGRSGRG